MKNNHKGSKFDAFLAEEGLLEHAHAVAIKRAIAFQLKEAMSRNKVTIQAMAKKMHTSRPAVDRLLDPENTSVTLNTLVKAAYALGIKIKLAIPI